VRGLLSGALLLILLSACSYAATPVSPGSSSSLSTTSLGSSPLPTSSVPPAMPGPSAQGSPGVGYVDPDVAAELAARCQVAGEIADYFVIPAGSTFQTVFPNAGKTPELDGRDRLFVAVYAGDVRILNYTGGGTSAPGASPQSMTFQNVVCVVPATGEVEVYNNVSKQGMALPAGTQTGPPSQPASSPPISADQARATALREASGTDVMVVSTELSTYGAKANGSIVDPKTVVWAVKLSGTFPPASCGALRASPHPCPPPASSELILIDAATGAFIQGEVPAP